MAAKRSQRELAEVAGFVRMLFERGQYARWSELAEDANVHRVSLSEWQNGQTCPDGYNLLKLIQAAARRAGGSLEALAGVPEEAAPDGRVSELERRLEEVADLTARGFEALGVSPAQLLPSEGEQGHTEATR